MFSCARLKLFLIMLKLLSSYFRTNLAYIVMLYLFLKVSKNQILVQISITGYVDQKLATNPFFYLLFLILYKLKFKTIF